MKYCNRDCLNCQHDKCINDYAPEDRQRILQKARYNRWLERNRERRKAYQHEYYMKKTAGSSHVKRDSGSRRTGLSKPERLFRCRTACGIERKENEDGKGITNTF